MPVILATSSCLLVHYYFYLLYACIQDFSEINVRTSLSDLCFEMIKDMKVLKTISAMQFDASKNSLQVSKFCS